MQHPPPPKSMHWQSNEGWHFFSKPVNRYEPRFRNHIETNRARTVCKTNRTEPDLQFSKNRTTNPYSTNMLWSDFFSASGSKCFASSTPHLTTSTPKLLIGGLKIRHPQFNPQINHLNAKTADWGVELRPHSSTPKSTTLTPKLLIGGLNSDPAVQPSNQPL